MIPQKGDKATQTVSLNGIDTTCYIFSWRKIAQQFGDNRVLDMTRFTHDTEEEVMREQEELWSRI